MQYSYNDLQKVHIQNYQTLFNRVHFQFVNPEHSSINYPTDKRVHHFRFAKNPSLLALYFQFGQYLLIALPVLVPDLPNLQDMEIMHISPDWASNWTLNCNAEINCWPAETANLAECHQPLINLTKVNNQWCPNSPYFIWL